MNDVFVICDFVVGGFNKFFVLVNFGIVFCEFKI